MSLTTRKAPPASISINLMQDKIPENPSETKYHLPFKNIAKTAFDALQQGVCFADMNLNVIYCNRKIAQIFGQSQQPLGGTPLFNLLPKKIHSHFRSKIEYAINTGDHASGEFVHKEGNSNRLTYQYEISIQQAKKTYPFLMISINMSRKSHENVVANDNAPDVKRTGDLILSVSQELAVPLNRVCVHIDKIIELLGNIQNSRLDSHLNGIVNQVYRISSLVHNLTAFSKHAAPTYVNINVNEIILDAIENCELNWGKKVALNLHLDETLPSVVGDPYLMTSVFQNLIRVADELAGDDAVPRLNTFLSKSKKHVTAVFETRGDISPPKKLDKLFEMRQEDSMLSPGGSLGLYISKKMLDVQQCKISMAANSEAGNIIELSIPVFSFIKKLHKKQI